MAENGTTTRRSDGSEIVLRALAAADLPAVCALHFATFRIQSSRRFLERAYYPTFVAPGSTGLGTFVSDAEGIVGYCVGTLDDGAFHRALLRCHPFECARAWIGKAVGRRRDRGGRLALHESRLHYVAVAPRARGAGLGRRLWADFLRRVSEAGHDRCATRIYADNPVSRRLAESLGGRLEREGTDALGRFGLYRFALDRTR